MLKGLFSLLGKTILYISLSLSVLSYSCVLHARLSPLRNSRESELSRTELFHLGTGFLSLLYFTPLNLMLKKLIVKLLLPFIGVAGLYSHIITINEVNKEEKQGIISKEGAQVSKNFIKLSMISSGYILSKGLHHYFKIK